MLEEIGKHPQFYKLGLHSANSPLDLKPEHQELWENIMDVMRTEYPEVAEDHVWKSWKWLRRYYHTTKCPQKYAGKIEFLERMRAEKEEERDHQREAWKHSQIVLNKVSTVEMRKTIPALAKKDAEEARSLRPKDPTPVSEFGMRKNHNFDMQHGQKYFPKKSSGIPGRGRMSVIDTFAVRYGDEACDLLFAQIGRFPAVYMPSCNIPEPSGLRDEARQNWATVMNVMNERYPGMDSLDAWRAWRTLRRNYNNSSCPKNWVGKLPFLNKLLANKEAIQSRNREMRRVDADNLEHYSRSGSREESWDDSEDQKNYVDFLSNLEATNDYDEGDLLDDPSIGPDGSYYNDYDQYGAEVPVEGSTAMELLMSNVQRASSQDEPSSSGKMMPMKRRSSSPKMPQFKRPRMSNIGIATSPMRIDEDPFKMTTPVGLQSFEVFVDRNFGPKLPMILQLIGKYPDLYGVDVWRMKTPAELDFVAKNNWNTVLDILRVKFPRMSESVLWMTWRWIRSNYHYNSCPRGFSGQIPYLDHASPSSSAYSSTPLTFQTVMQDARKPDARIRSRITYLNHAVSAPKSFIWSSMNSFLRQYGEEPINLLIDVIEMQPAFYRLDLENELVPNQLQGAAAVAWSKCCSIVHRTHPYIMEISLYHAWRTLRRNFDHEQCPMYWSNKVRFIRNVPNVEYLDPIAGPSRMQRITTINEAWEAINEVDNMDRMMGRPDLKRRAQDEPQKQSWPWFDTQQQAPQPIIIEEGEPSEEYADLSSYSTIISGDKPKRTKTQRQPSTRTQRKRITDIYLDAPSSSQRYQEPPRHRFKYHRNLAEERRLAARRLDAEIDEHVNAELRDFLAELRRGKLQERAKTSERKVITIVDEEDADEVVILGESVEEPSSSTSEPGSSHVEDSFKTVLKDKWMEMAATAEAKNHLSEFKKGILTVVNKACNEAEKQQS
ncbi:hypothetical protein L596_019637 [Steinernema carpocapsae]|uniref:MADF domain-containing protein n=2 Tax=Steinernema carpocapsae TaxID=34508 RepID=A0A4U5MR36_STECR|nr:hypothetical protein L596_019637 [Steinernema carpocapsae]